MNTLCSFNHTYAVTNLNDDAVANIKGKIILYISNNKLKTFLFINLIFFSQDNKYLIGVLGKNLDDIFVKRHLRKCKLIGNF